MTVWPYLLGGCAVAAIWNWRAALVFALAIIAGQATTRLELSQVDLLAAYTLLAVVATFFIDRYSGLVLAAFGLVIGAHLLGFIGHLPKIIAGEVLLVAGMLFSGFNGASGGLWTRNNTPAVGRRNSVFVADTSRFADNSVPSGKAD